MREEALKWFEQAVEDLSTAEDLLRIGRYHAAASHQAAEKALKALLIERGKAVRTHDLIELLDVIEREIGLDVSSLREDTRKLTVHYVVSRYPDAANAVPARLYSRQDAEDLQGQEDSGMDKAKSALESQREMLRRAKRFADRARAVYKIDEIYVVGSGPGGTILRTAT